MALRRFRAPLRCEAGVGLQELELRPKRRGWFCGNGWLVVFFGRVGAPVFCGFKGKPKGQPPFCGSKKQQPLQMAAFCFGNRAQSGPNFSKTPTLCFPQAQLRGGERHGPGPPWLRAAEPLPGPGRGRNSPLSHRYGTSVFLESTGHDEVNSWPCVSTFNLEFACCQHVMVKRGRSQCA